MMQWIPQDLSKKETMTFAEWLERVDHWLLDRAMLTHDNIDNYDWKDAFEQGVSPLRAAIEGLFDVNIEDLL